MTSSLLAPAAGPDLTSAWPGTLQLLLGEAAVDLWTAALAPTGAALRGLRATSVSLRTDGSATVQYAAALEVAGRPARDTLAATTGSRIPPGAAVLAGDVDGAETRVGLWRWPHDPPCRHWRGPPRPPRWAGGSARPTPSCGCGRTGPAAGPWSR
ncbi:hypothetical protein ACFQX8_25220 [Klenkia terrae]|uniref:hypothetical protein n=1 Tax=Klenkia terrae TaxID=1052259 RepID=UPI00360E12EE